MTGADYLFFRHRSQESDVDIMSLEYELKFLSRGKIEAYIVDPSSSDFMADETLPMLKAPNGAHIRGIEAIEIYVGGLREQVFSSH